MSSSVRIATLTLLLTASITIASDVSFSCITRNGPSATGVGAISQTSCHSQLNETLVSCGLRGSFQIGGSWIENGVCNALSNYNETIGARARCCVFPPGAIASESTTTSSDGESVTASCLCNETLTGCHVYYQSGEYGKLQGSFSGPFTSTPQTTSWISTDNQCNAQSYAGGTVKAAATCLRLNAGYALDCVTKAKFTHKSKFGGCDSGYTMMSCNVFTDTKTLESYYVNHGECQIEQGHHANMYANAICCKLSTYDITVPHHGETSNTRFDCECDENCTINCDEIDPYNGCSNAVIDGRKASSLHVICSSSQNDYNGGCQMSIIYCPESLNAECNVVCADYFGCYFATIYSRYQYDSGRNYVNIQCKDEEGSCLKTTLYADKCSNVDVSCYGSGILESKQHSACHDFQIHVEDVNDEFNLLCSGDWSCFNMYLHASQAHSVKIGARGNMALATSYIYAENAQELDLFCGSEESEYGCHKLYIYNPEYSSTGLPRTTVECQGHGCYSEMYFQSAHGAVDLNILLNGCAECNDVASCISHWDFYCDDSTFDTFSGGSCVSEYCDCPYAANMMKANWINNVDECDVFTFDYECASDTDCMINCMEQWPDDNGCYDKTINGNNATSLTVICNSTTDNPAYGGCESAHIWCPRGDNTRCDVLCHKKHSCYETEITVVNMQNAELNLKCTNAYSCSDTNIYGASNEVISIDCIATESCDNINVTANVAANITVHCEGNAYDKSYASCNGFIIWAQNVTNNVHLVCNGEYACYSIDIYANDANNVIVDTIGHYGSYGGNIYASHANSMLISCKSQYGEYGCYKMAFYIAEKATALQCQGHGCYLLELYALNGFTDLIDININGCGECSQFEDCISTWSMHCGQDFAIENTLNSLCQYGDTCECTDNNFHTLITNGWRDDSTQCNVVHPDQSCVDNEACVIDCVLESCQGDVIVGNNALSLRVNCGENGCHNTMIYCPSQYHSECIVSCIGYGSCHFIEIYAQKDSIFDLKCDSDYACRNASVDISDTFRSNINCTVYDACISMTLYGDNAEDITMNCIGNMEYGSYGYFSGNYSNVFSAVCKEFTIHAKNAKSVALNCIGNDACYPTLIDAQNAHNVVINAIGCFSIESGFIYAQNANDLWLNFEGHKYGVKYVNIYLPSNDATHLTCIGYGCDVLYLFMENGMTDLNDISFYGCGQCIKPEICITNWNLYCDDSYSTLTSFSGSICEENNCGCNALSGEIGQAFTLNIESIEDGTNIAQCKNSSFTADLTCIDGTKCFMDCAVKDCMNKVIYGGNALSLTVHCDNEYTCNQIQVFCPETADSECNLLCNGFDSCYGSILYADHHNTVYIFASEQYSFEHSTIYAYDAIKVNVNCTNQESCYSSSIYASKANNVGVLCYDNDDDEYAIYNEYESTSPCFALNIYASSVADTLQLRCKGEYSCYGIFLYADNAQHLIVIGDNGEYGMEDAFVYASNVSAFELICIGSINNYGCGYSNIYLPSNPQQINISCYGFGCNNMYLYSNDGMHSLSLSNIILNSCGVCSDQTKCINAWYIYCNEWSAYDRFTVFDGLSCLSYAQQCGCQQNVDLLQSVFINDPSMPNCYQMTKGVVPSIEPTAIKQHSNHRNDYHVFVIPISLTIICICCVCILCIYCYKRRVNEKIAHQILEEEEEGGIQNIAPEPTTKTDKQKKQKLLQYNAPRDGNNTATITAVTTYTLSNQK